MQEHEHIRGLLWSGMGAIGGAGSWFLAHLQIINALAQFCVLSVSLIAGLIGLRKLLKVS